MWLNLRARVGQQMKANLVLAGLEQQLNYQQGKLTERVVKATRGKRSNRDVIAIVFPIDVTTTTANLATALGLKI
jgi:poly-gamma-glutamate capsule biosynthesis protein CapA/YwtB (metallophosphatase superfamily)